MLYERWRSGRQTAVSASRAIERRPAAPTKAGEHHDPVVASLLAMASVQASALS